MICSATTLWVAASSQFAPPECSELQHRLDLRHQNALSCNMTFFMLPLAIVVERSHASQNRGHRVMSAIAMEVTGVLQHRPFVSPSSDFLSDVC
jgi:hypothetical protein